MNQSRRVAGRSKGTTETAAERKARAEAVRKAEEKRLAEEARREKEALEKAEADKLRLAQKGYQPLAETAAADSDSKIGGGSIAQLAKYLYFAGEQISTSVSFPEVSGNKGYDLYVKGKVDNVELSTGYDEYHSSGESLGQAMWHVKAGQSEFVTTVVFNKNRVVNRQCGCPTCAKRQSWYGWYDMDDPDCQYMAALLYWVKDYLKSHNIGDATDKNAERLMAANRRRRSNILVADKTWKEESLTLKPRLIKKDGTLTASFKVGTGRLFVIKQLDEFCANVRNCATATYGSNTQINHRRSNFNQESQNWLRFIERIVQEEEEFGQRMEDAARSRYYYPRSVRVGGSLNLFGWRLDEFYNEIGDGDVEYEDRDAQPVVKTRLRQGEGNPRIPVNISEYKEKRGQTSSTQQARGTSQAGTARSSASSSAEFHGIQVSGRLPELSFGMDCAYYVSGDRLFRSENGYRERIGSLVSMSGEDGSFAMLIGRNNMSEFYYQILPAMQDILEVKENNPDRIHSFLPPQVNFVFYLDADENDAFCESYARYEDKSFSMTDWLDESRKTDVETYRDYTAEQEVLYRLLGWLPQVNLKRKELSCGGDEDRIYRLMSEGVEELLSLGEVQCTDRFRSR
ncbi:MAG: SNF2 helicase associated domain-containing protein, partial [Lachnospiraceae bacterium]|nr:SNF2 helicase associated domain-containing protein [Lachnospiraceae bacterium]